MRMPNNQLVQLLWTGEYQRIIALVNQTLQAGNETSVHLAIAGVALHNQGLQTQALEAFLLAGKKNQHVNLVAKDLFGLEELLFLCHPSIDLSQHSLHHSMANFQEDVSANQSIPGHDLLGYLMELMEIATFCCLQTQPKLAITYFQQYEIEKSALEFTHEQNYAQSQLTELEEVFHYCFSNYFNTPVEYVVALGTMKDLLDCIDEDDKISIRCYLHQAKTKESKLIYSFFESIPLIEQNLDFLFHLHEIDRQAIVYLLGFGDLLSLSDHELMNKAYQYI